MIAGSTVLASVAAPASSSTTPYKIYTVTNSTGVLLYGFVLTNTGNIPVTYTLFQNSYSNVITSGTLASGGSATYLITRSLGNAETILATASVGGILQVEVDGQINSLDPVSQMIFGLMVQFAEAFGVQIPTQGMMNAGSYTF